MNTSQMVGQCAPTVHDIGGGPIDLDLDEADEATGGIDMNLVNIGLGVVGLGGVGVGIGYSIGAGRAGRDNSRGGGGNANGK